MSSSGRRDGGRGQKIGEEEKARRKRNRMGETTWRSKATRATMMDDGDDGDDDDDVMNA
jgi:hypothetical protein